MVHISTNFHVGWRRTAARPLSGAISLCWVNYKVFQGVCRNNPTGQAATRSLSPSPPTQKEIPKESHFSRGSVMRFPQSVQSLRASRWRSGGARLENVELCLVTQLSCSPWWSIQCLLELHNVHVMCRVDVVRMKNKCDERFYALKTHFVCTCCKLRPWRLVLFSKRKDTILIFQK